MACLLSSILSLLSKSQKSKIPEAFYGKILFVSKPLQGNVGFMK